MSRITMVTAQDTGMKFNADRTELLEIGPSPILLAPVKADLQLSPARRELRMCSTIPATELERQYLSRKEN